MLKFKIGKIEIILCFSFFAVIALLELLKENNYLLLCLTACILHELGHIFAMCLFSIAPNKITFYGAGIKITPGYNKITAFSQDLIILMAGSVTNLIIFAFITLFRNHNFTNEVFAAINLSIGRITSYNVCYTKLLRTCVCGIIRNDTIFISNVGDSRAYLISGNSMEQLTKDHSYVQLLYEQGEITKEEIKTHNKRNVITKAVGIDDNISPDYYEIEFPENSVLLLCTDGLSSYCNEDVICEIISKNNVLDACSMLIDKANDNGGKDNITVALVV